VLGSGAVASFDGSITTLSGVEIRSAPVDNAIAVAVVIFLCIGLNG
jgi:hypothetical protein